MEKLPFQDWEVKGIPFYTYESYILSRSQPPTILVMSLSQSSSPKAGQEVEKDGYTLAIIGCGTMGVAVLSGVLDSKRASEAKRVASAALSNMNSTSSPTTNGIDTDLSASIASLLKVDDDDESGEGSSSQQTIQLPSHFLACVSRTESAKRLRKTFQEYSNQVEVYASDNLAAIKKSDVVILACKPQMVKDVLEEEGIKDALRGKLVCSICAGLRIKSIQQWLHGDSTVVRAMPNTPAKVRSREVQCR
jgi:pyrroline-5-carboxylate reductase